MDRAGLPDRFRAHPKFTSHFGFGVKGTEILGHWGGVIVYH